MLTANQTEKRKLVSVPAVLQFEPTLICPHGGVITAAQIYPFGQLNTSRSLNGDDRAEAAELWTQPSKDRTSLTPRLRDSNRSSEWRARPGVSGTSNQFMLGDVGRSSAARRSGSVDRRGIVEDSSHRTGIIYVVSNPAMPGLVKIGRTMGDHAKPRIDQLYQTGVPVPFKLEFACRVPNPEQIERALHTAFAPSRIGARREFFRIDAKQAIAILKLLNSDDAPRPTLQAKPPAELVLVSEGKRRKRRRPNFAFDRMGIPLGAELTSTAIEGLTVTVSGPKKVKLAGEELSLTAATQKVLGVSYAAPPATYWQYQGTLLRELYEQTYPTEDAPHAAEPGGATRLIERLG